MLFRCNKCSELQPLFFIEQRLGASSPLVFGSGFAAKMAANPGPGEEAQKNPPGPASRVPGDFFGKNRRLFSLSDRIFLLRFPCAIGFF